ncbi:MAG: molecular chaperone DnaJ [Planctomycetes bacterium]|nr:molecular chaperone DnaJ [Planctomycetota bacterium]
MNVAEALAELELDSDATDDAIRARYRELVKQHPPERDPERFKTIRACYELAIDPRARATERVLGPEPYTGIADLRRDLLRLPRRPLGASGWLEVLRS